MNKKRLVCLFLVLQLLLSAAAGCSKTDNSAVSDSPDTHSGDASVTDAEITDASAEETEPENARSSAKDNLPEDLDYNGAAINIVYRNEEYYSNWDMLGTENSGDIIWDAIWLRNMKVEERLNLDMNIQPTQSEGLSNVAAELKNMVYAGVNDYDIISSTANTTVTQSLYPFLYELSDLSYLEITQPWWRTSAIEELALEEGRYRYLLGDHTLNNYLKCGVIFYNKNMYTDTYGNADEMYELVLDGTWTYDELTSRTATAYMDLNGDGTPNPGDAFGLMVPSGYSEATVHMIYSCDIDTYTRKDGGAFDLSPFNNERIINSMDKIIQLLHNTPGVYQSDKGIDASLDYFAQNYSLFWSGRLTNAVTAAFREMESDYGILPMPKYDTAQEDYVTLIHSSTTVTCVPKSISPDKLDMAGAVLEAWASEAYRQVITPFIESALKSKYSRDALSGQVIDLIFENPMLSFLDMYGGNTGSLLNNTVISNLASGQNNFASKIAANLKGAQKVLDRYLSDIVESDGG